MTDASSNRAARIEQLASALYQQRHGLPLSKYYHSDEAETFRQTAAVAVDALDAIPNRAAEQIRAPYCPQWGVEGHFCPICNPEMFRDAAEYERRGFPFKDIPDNSITTFAQDSDATRNRVQCICDPKGMPCQRPDLCSYWLSKNPDATRNRAAEIPVRIKVSQESYWYLVHHAKAFDGDLDAAILDLLKRYKASDA